jgi:hypothetical protein
MAGSRSAGALADLRDRRPGLRNWGVGGIEHVFDQLGGLLTADTAKSRHDFSN